MKKKTIKTNHSFKHCKLTTYMYLHREMNVYNLSNTQSDSRLSSVKENINHNALIRRDNHDLSHSAHGLNSMRADYMAFQASHETNVSYSTETISFSDLAPIHTIPNSNTIVVIPSMDLDRKELKRVCPVVEYYEERQLYHLFLLVRDPSFRIIFLSSHPVCEDIIKYYLSIDGCSHEDIEERMSRLHLISLQDIGESNLSLSENILEKEEVIQNIRNIVNEVSVGAFPTVGLSAFCGSDTISQLTTRLGIRLLEASDISLYFGSKQGR